MSICVSFSGMQLYNQCPSAFQRRYVTKEPVPKGEASPAMTRGTRVHEGVESYLLHHTEELPDEAMGFEGLFTEMRDKYDTSPELQWAFDPEWEEVNFTDTDEAMVRGVLDAGYEHEGVAHVIELKTGKMYEEHADQRSLYGLAGALLYPDNETILVETIYLDAGIKHFTEFSMAQLPSLQWIWQRTINGCQPPQPYPQRKSWKCKWCPYHEDKGGMCNGKTT